MSLDVTIRLRAITFYTTYSKAKNERNCGANKMFIQIAMQIKLNHVNMNIQNTAL